MKYSKAFKEAALKLSDEIGLKKAAQQLGIQYYTLSDWRSKRSAAIKAQKYQISDSAGITETKFAGIYKHCSNLCAPLAHHICTNGDLYFSDTKCFAACSMNGSIQDD